MWLLFETLRWLFIVLTFFLIILLVSGERILDTDIVKALHEITMPAYLILAGLLVWYILSLLTVNKAPITEQQKKLQQRSDTTAYIQWLIIGIFLALLYIFIV